jgi:hypothetical protein
MSEVKVNKISPRTACGTVQLGDSGDTITIPAGASITNSGTASGFGATGAASWNTTVKTGDFTAVNGEGYFVNTTSGEIDVALPAGTAGAVVAIKDYARTFHNNNCILVPNGSDKIGGLAQNATLKIQGQSVTLVFIDATKGWLVTDSGLQSDANQAQYITATGGTITTSGDFKIHTFTGPGTFCVSCAGNDSGSDTVDYLVIAGGGAGGAHGGDGATVGGGGGAGGYRESHSTPVSGSYTASPLATPTGITVTATAFPITVGAGGTPSFPGNCASGAQGSNSIFSTITSAGGGAGNGAGMTCVAKGNGGSGGGGRAAGSPVGGGSGNTPPVSPAQGKDGGDGQSPKQGGGGGGAINAGSPGNPPAAVPGNTGRGGGGIGATSSINGTPTQRAGGGGGANTDVPNNGGAGGGGAGPPSSSGGTGVAGTANTGGGGGGGPHGQPSPTNNGGAGGSGIVIIRYKFQN